MGVRAKSVHECVRHLSDRRILVKEPFFLGIRDKAHLEEDRRASRFEENPERSLLHAAVRTVEMPHEAFLDLLGKLERLVHETILHQFEHDIRIDRIGVETLVRRLIIRLEFHHGVLTHSDIEVFLHFLRSENKSLNALGIFRCRSVSMDRDEEVCVVFVRYIRARLERDEHIRRTGVHNVYIRVLLIKQFAYFENQRKVEIFLERELTYRSRVLTAMSGIEDDGIVLRRRKRKRHQENTGNI